MADTSFICIRLEELMAWLESRLIEKYSVSLEGIEKRFISVFSHFEGILANTVEIHEILKDSGDLAQGKIYLDNMMY